MKTLDYTKTETFNDNTILDMELYGERSKESIELLREIKDIHLFKNVSFVIYTNKKENKVYVLKNRFDPRQLNDKQLVETYLGKKVIKIRNIILDRESVDEYIKASMNDGRHIAVLIEN